MENKKNVFKLLSATIMLVALASCGSSGAQNAEVATSTGGGNYSSTSSQTRKVIYQVDYTVYGDDFHKVASEISAKAVELQGYVLNSKEDNQEGHYVFKIPTDKLNLFVSFVDTYDVGSKTMETSDVTGNFQDVDTILEELKAEKEELIAKMNDSTIPDSEFETYRKRLIQVESYISYYEEKKTEQDKVIAYSTVTIAFYESKQTESDIYWSNYYYYLKVVGKDLGSILLYSAPFAGISGVAIAIAWFITKKKD